MLPAALGACAGGWCTIKENWLCLPQQLSNTNISSACQLVAGFFFSTSLPQCWDLPGWSSCGSCVYAGHNRCESCVNLSCCTSLKLTTTTSVCHLFHTHARVLWGRVWCRHAITVEHSQVPYSLHNDQLKVFVLIPSTARSGFSDEGWERLWSGVLDQIPTNLCSFIDIVQGTSISYT